jgi:hypothetical protein
MLIIRRLLAESDLLGTIQLPSAGNLATTRRWRWGKFAGRLRNFNCLLGCEGVESVCMHIRTIYTVPRNGPCLKEHCRSQATYKWVDFDSRTIEIVCFDCGKFRVTKSQLDDFLDSCPRGRPIVCNLVRVR